MSTTEHIQYYADEYYRESENQNNFGRFLKKLLDAFPGTPEEVVLGEHRSSKIKGQPTLGDKLRTNITLARENFLNKIAESGVGGLFPLLRDKYKIAKNYKHLSLIKNTFQEAIFEIENYLLKSGFENLDEYFINGKFNEEKFNKLKSDVSIIGLKKIDPLFKEFKIDNNDFINISLTNVFEIVKGSLENNSINISNFKNLDSGKALVEKLENNGIELDWFKNDMENLIGKQSNEKTQIAGEISFRLVNSSWASIQGARAIIEQNPSRINTKTSENFKSFDDMILGIYNKYGGGEKGFLRAVYEVAKDFGEIVKMINITKGKTKNILENK